MNLSLLQELTLLNEAVEATSEKSEAVKEAKPHLNKISMMLFGKKCEPVVDEKRGKEAKFFGVANSRSKLQDAKGKSIKLTFDNSTDSGEFEINSLTPLRITQGGELDKQIKALYKKHKVASKKKINYLDIDGDMVLREIHLGTSPNEHAVKLVRDALKLIHGEKVEDDEAEPVKKEKEVSEDLLSEASLPLLSDLLKNNKSKSECYVVKAYISGDKSLEIDDSDKGIRVYGEGTLKQCQDWILKHPKFRATIIGADSRMKSHRVPSSYGI